MNDDGRTIDDLRADVASLLGVASGDLAEDDSLYDQGLDSVRLMSLVERWRTRGMAITFAELAETPTLKAWHTLISSKRSKRA